MIDRIITLYLRNLILPIQFALEELIPKDTVKPGERIHHWNSTQVYHPVPQDVAETDPQGMFSLLGADGTQVTPWIRLILRMELEGKQMKSSGKPHKDILGEELAVGDFVATSQTETADLEICRVLSFSEKKVRVARYGHGLPVIFKNPSGLIKIQPSALSE